MEYREVSIEVIPGLRGICQEYGEDGFGEAWLNITRLFMTEGFSRLRQERLLQRKGMKKVIVMDCQVFLYERYDVPVERQR